MLILTFSSHYILMSTVQNNNNITGFKDSLQRLSPPGPVKIREKNTEKCTKIFSTFNNFISKFPRELQTIALTKRTTTVKHGGRNPKRTRRHYQRKYKTKKRIHKH